MHFTGHSILGWVSSKGTLTLLLLEDPPSRPCWTGRKALVSSARDLDKRHWKRSSCGNMQCEVICRYDLVVVVCFALFVMFCFAFIQVNYNELINDNFVRNTWVFWEKSCHFKVFPLNRRLNESSFFLIYIYVWLIQRVQQWFGWMKLYIEAACEMTNISKSR